MALDPNIAALIAGQEFPDLVGQFERGRQLRKQAREEAAAEQTRQLTGQILGQRFSPGSQMAELAGADPNAALQLSQALGIPLDQPGRLKQFANDVRQARVLASTNPQAAFNFIVEARDRRNLAGIPTPQMDEFITQAQVDPETTMSQLGQLDDQLTSAGLLPETIVQKEARERERIAFEQQEKQIGELQVAREESRLRRLEEKQKAAKGGKTTANQSDFAHYRKLLREGKTEQAEQFGRVAGILPEKTEFQTNVARYLELPEGSEEKEALAIRLGISKAKSPADLRKDAEEVDEIDTLRESQESTLALIDNFLINPDDSPAIRERKQGYINAMTGLRGRTPTVTQEGFDAESDFDQLLDSLTMANLEKLTGTKTDEDIRLLKSAASGIKPGISDIKLAEKLSKIRELIKANIKRGESKRLKLTKPVDMPIIRDDGTGTAPPAGSGPKFLGFE